MYVNYMIVPVAAFEYSMARKLVNCKPSIPVSEKNRKEQILFPLFHTENNFLSFFITEIVKSIIPETNCLIIDFLLSLYYMLLIKSITDSLFAISNPYSLISSIACIAIFMSRSLRA